MLFSGWEAIHYREKPQRTVHNKALQVLGVGCQVLAFGIHPDTQEPYPWPPEGDPTTTPAARLRQG